MRELILSLVFVLTYALSDIFPFGKLSKELTGYYQRIFNVLANANTTDTRKQKVLLIYSILLFKRTIYLILLMVVVIGFLFLATDCFSYLLYKDKSLIQNMVSREGALVSVMAFILYYFSKKLYAKIRL